MNADMKLIELGTYCNGIGHGKLTGNMREVALDIAKDLARELLPVKAKALVWHLEENKSLSGKVLGNLTTHVIFYALERFHARDFDGESIAEDMESIAEAMSACEAHHQSRFLEQLA